MNVQFLTLAFSLFIYCEISTKAGKFGQLQIKYIQYTIHINKYLGRFQVSDWSKPVWECLEKSE